LEKSAQELGEMTHDLDLVGRTNRFQNESPAHLQMISNDHTASKLGLSSPQ